MITLLLSLLALGVPNVDEIVERAQNSIFLPQHKTELHLIVQKKRRNKEYQLSVYQDRESSMGSAEFHAPVRDRGTKFLRKKDALWIFLPSIEKNQTNRWTHATSRCDGF